MAGRKSLALRLAAEVFARYMRRNALTVMRSERTAAAVNIKRITSDVYHVNAGRPVIEVDKVGPWGWEPINAWMFETSAQHPLFGDEARQYKQPYRPILNKTAEDGMDEANLVYGYRRADELARDFGYK